MTEKDLDIAIEKCERIMEFDTRTLKNPESENGWIFEKVYDLLKFLRQCQFDINTNVGGNLIDRQAAIDAMMKLQAEDIEAYGVSIPEGFDGDRAVAALKALSPAQPTKGHWIKDTEQKHVEIMYHCSECGFRAWGRYEKTKFCGGCGVKMGNAYE